MEINKNRAFNTIGRFFLQEIFKICLFLISMKSINDQILKEILLKN
jgi:hypothetical protein